ncbi:trimeric intracellular cation channel family protein [Mucilaginibacter sp.]|uniref:trimeric intracellular cation channel family protein n=1 Tax=Mucilaginibacter sp. TaxID=1882438 RepID=UPI0025CF09D5|nr:trimeric intracellular cation channel family protein [Mucilaginibacter sp.]
MHIPFSLIIEILGTIAFTISGVFSAMQKKLDLFGVLIIGFVTAVGGGTIRDVLIGNTPVTWMKDIITPLIILGTAIVTICFKQLVKNLKVTLFLFDALGLGLFTVIGIQKGLDAGLNPGICVALGTITGCFGGVLRDLLLSQIPVLFQKEIYATACIIGGTVYVISLSFINQQFAEAIAVILICGIRIFAVRLNWKLPSIKI